MLNLVFFKSQDTLVGLFQQAEATSAFNSNKKRTVKIETPSRLLGGDYWRTGTNGGSLLVKPESEAIPFPAFRKQKTDL